MRDERQMTDSCVYLADCYEDLFFGNVNKRYRSMTAAQLKSRMERLNAQTLEEVAKPNELSDIHAMTAKACSYVMGRRQRARTCLLYTSRCVEETGIEGGAPGKNQPVQD